jgi:transcription termination/antitermination protein NusG
MKHFLPSHFSPGDRVKIIDGTFIDREGRVVEVLEDYHWVRVELIIYGRPVPVELECWQIEKLPMAGGS